MTGIDLWWFRLEDAGPAAERLLDLLDAGERMRFRRFDDPALARLFAGRRGIRRLVLASYLDAPPADLRFGESVTGKPHLAAPGTGLQFNTSHSGTAGVIAVSGASPVGADLEMARPFDAAALGERIMSPAERMAEQSAATGDRAARLLALWTAKEALVKGIGLGLDLAAFRQIEVPPDPGDGGWRPVALGGRLADYGAWHVSTRSLPNGGLVSIATPTPAPLTVIDAQSILVRYGRC